MGGSRPLSVRRAQLHRRLRDRPGLDGRILDALRPVRHRDALRAERPAVGDAMRRAFASDEAVTGFYLGALVVSSGAWAVASEAGIVAKIKLS